MPGDSDGAGPREDVLPALPDAVWHQTSALGRHHTQGGKTVAFFVMFSVWEFNYFHYTHVWAFFKFLTLIQYRSPENSTFIPFLQLILKQLPAKIAALLHLHMKESGSKKEKTRQL